MANGHGGYRPGAGRKPKALKYEEQVNAVEEKIVRMLPRLVDKLYEMAMEGDIRATRYLMDRILGRVPMLAAVPSTDCAVPYTERDFEMEALERGLDLAEDEVRLDGRIDNLFPFARPSEQETSDALIPMSPEETANLLRQARMEQQRIAEAAPWITGEGNATTDEDDTAAAHAHPVDARVDSAGDTSGDVVEGVPQSPTTDASNVPFVPSDGPDDPDRTWYHPD